MVSPLSLTTFPKVESGAIQISMTAGVAVCVAASRGFAVASSSRYSLASSRRSSIPRVGHTSG
eukprot:13522267-Heterocapsa_arctica.AAC.1